METCTITNHLVTDDGKNCICGYFIAQNISDQLLKELAQA